MHGNLPALEAVLDDIERRGADLLVINGDVVNRGPDSRACLERLLNLPRQPLFTLGNHDDLLWLWQTRSELLPAEWFDDPFWASTAWNAHEVEDLLGIVKSWPMVIDLPGGVRVAHGTADHYREGLSHRISDERLNALGRGHRMLVGSHIHSPVLREHGALQVVNSGAVGVSVDGDRRISYAMIHRQGDILRPEIVRVAYEVAAAERRFSESGYLDTGLSAEIFRNELVRAQSLYTPFWEWTEKERMPRDPSAWRAFTRRFALERL